MDMFYRLLYTALGVASICYFFMKASLSHWKNRGILHEKPKFLWGNLKGVGSGKKHISTALQEIYKKYKGSAPFIGFYAYLKPMALVLDLNLIRRILKEDASYFTDRGLYHNINDDPLSGNMWQLDGLKCQQLRVKLQSAFDYHSVELMLPALRQVATTFERSFAKQQSAEKIVTINELVDCYNVDVISALCFGLEGDSLLCKETEFRLKTRSYFKNFSLLKTYLAWVYPNIARLLQYKNFDIDATQYFIKLINDKTKEREWNRLPSQNDFLACFAKLKKQRDPNVRLSNKELAAQAFAFILVGLAPCNSTLAFCLYELALQPELQQRARFEICEVLGRQQDKITPQSLKEMQFLKQILCETLRKYSPYPLLLRDTVKDYEVPESVFMLKEHNHLIIPVSAIHLDPQIYPDPLKFDPDRFLPASISQRHSMAWLPFGFGPRNCIAQHFVEQQMLVCLISLLKDYQFKPYADTCIPLEYDNSKLILTPKSDIKLLVDRV